MGHRPIRNFWTLLYIEMKILRQYNGYSLVKSSQTENKSLKFYLDDGDDTTEYFDQYEASLLMKLSDVDFENHCIEVFRPSFRLIRI